MIGRVKTYITSQIVISVLYILFGLSLFIFPEASTNLLGNVLAVFLILFGLYLVLLDFRGGFLLVVDLLPGGLISLVFGSIILIHPGILKTLIPIIVGIWVLASSSLNIKLSLYMKEVEGHSWLVTLIIALVAIVAGILLIANPAAGTNDLTTFVGVLIIIYAIANIIDNILFKKYLRRIAGYMRKHMKRVDE